MLGKVLGKKVLWHVRVACWHAAIVTGDNAGKATGNIWLRERNVRLNSHDSMIDQSKEKRPVSRKKERSSGETAK